ISMDFLSMGMSGDYADAIRYGSNIIRIGRGLFGPRNYA
ncbi:MAG: YggS family pyridoxal phosphate-dependent enzyme, partial [Porcipelethomonas sp.]